MSEYSGISGTEVDGPWYFILWSDRQYEEIETILEKTARKSFDQDIDWCLTLGPAAYTVAELAESCKDIVKTRHLCFYAGWNVVVRHASLQEYPQDHEPIDTALLYRCLRGGDQNQCDRIWQQHFEHLRKNRSVDVPEIIDELTSVIQGLRQIQWENLGAKLDEKEAPPIPTPATLNDLERYCTDTTRAIMKSLDERRKHTHHVFLAKKMIRERLSEPLSLSEIAEQLNLSDSYLSRTFKRECGLSFTDFLNNSRIEKALHLIDTTNLPMGRIAERVGFSNSDYFSKVFRKKHRMTPSQYRKSLK